MCGLPLPRVLGVLPIGFFCRQNDPVGLAGAHDTKRETEAEGTKAPCPDMPLIRLPSLFRAACPPARACVHTGLP